MLAGVGSELASRKRQPPHGKNSVLQHKYRVIMVLRRANTYEW